MRRSLADVLNAATGAVPSFTCYTLEQASGVITAAERLGAPSCLLLAPSAFNGPGGALLASCLVAAADSSPLPIAVQLDHTTDLDLMRAALDLGVTAVMADGSKLPFADNVELVCAASELAARYDASVEAELGHVPGSEDRAIGAKVGAFTDPDLAARFVELCQPDLMAVAVGNVHGTYPSEPRLDFTTLTRIAERADLALSLHGTSGIPDTQVRQAIRLGVKKFNVNTELRRVYLESAQHLFNVENKGFELLGPLRQLIQRTDEAAASFIELAAASPLPAAPLET
jgi:ketose-bisphosphate aldolase